MAEACEQFAARVISIGDNPTAETTWHIFGATSESDAYDALSAVPLPALYSMPDAKICYLDTIQLKDVAEGTDDHVLTHSATARYSYKPPEDSIDYEFEAGSQNVTLTHALETAAYTGGGRTAPNWRRGINISSDGKIQGIDIEVPRFSFALTISWPTELITQTYQLTMAGIVGSVNTGTYYGLPQGSVKFLGGRGRKQGARFPVTYRFEYSHPSAGETIGDISVGAREGWTYLDIYRAAIADSSAKKKVEFPHTAYLHRVYPYANFALLGLGTG